MDITTIWPQRNKSKSREISFYDDDNERTIFKLVYIKCRSRNYLPVYLSVRKQYIVEHCSQL